MLYNLVKKIALIFQMPKPRLKDKSACKRNTWKMECFCPYDRGLMLSEVEKFGVFIFSDKINNKIQTTPLIFLT